MRKYENLGQHPLFRSRFICTDQILQFQLYALGTMIESATVGAPPELPGRTRVRHGRKSPAAISGSRQSMNELAMERLTLEESPRKAHALAEFQVHYQPQIDLRDGKLVGVEALLRWMSPELGPVSPAKFIPIAEDSAAITSVIIAMARRLSLSVVAEGIETEAQRRFLLDNGCDVMQGYLVSPPLPADEVEALFDQHFFAASAPSGA